MRKRKNFRKRKPRENQLKGLQVEVYNNNVEGALKVFKKKIKDSNLFLDLKKKSYYEKPSAKRRQRKNLAKLRNKYSQQKVQKNY
jgi:small subunit ribosomal protein S21|tara:strand:+ start:321 stop:575 length:255 start_codon:yes stop_codon:yes gene_type:complete